MSRYEQLSPRILIMHAEDSTDRPILAAVEGDRRTLLIDAGNSSAHAAQFRSELERRGKRQPELLALTHWHWDHTFGMSEWGIPAIAHKQTAAVLERLMGLEWTDEAIGRLIPQGLASERTVRDMQAEYGDERNIELILPDIRFEEGLAVDLGGLTCDIRHMGGDHSEDSCFIHVKEEGVLFVGDALAYSVYGGPSRYTGSQFRRLMEEVWRLSPAIVVESHSVPMTAEEFRKDIAPWEELARLDAICGGDRSALAAGLRTFMNLKTLTPELEQAVDSFMNGAV